MTDNPLWALHILAIDVRERGFKAGGALVRATPEDVADIEKVGADLQVPPGLAIMSLSPPPHPADDSEEAQQYVGRFLTDDEWNAACKAVGLPHMPDEDEKSED